MTIWDSHKWLQKRIQRYLQEISGKSVFDAFHGSDPVIWVWWILQLYKKDFVNPKNSIYVKCGQKGHSSLIILLEFWYCNYFMPGHCPIWLTSTCFVYNEIYGGSKHQDSANKKNFSKNRVVQYFLLSFLLMKFVWYCFWHQMRFQMKNVKLYWNVVNFSKYYIYPVLGWKRLSLFENI